MCVFSLCAHACWSVFLRVCSPPRPSSATENVKRQRGRGERDSAWTVMRQDSFTAVGHAAESDTGWI